MADAMSHRGPDGRGVWQGRTAGPTLGHVRLSIIDLSVAGHQPMTNEDGSVVLVFNGEIYNFQELRRELAEKGHVFRSRTDSEVLVHGWEEWGRDLVSKLRGMFAFAVWDARRQMLFLGRDPLGIKPLYYWWTPQGGLGFASEAKAFLGLSGFAGMADPKGLRQFLEFGFIPDSHRTSLEGLRKLPPGHQLAISSCDLVGRRRPEPRQYFTTPRPESMAPGQASIDLRADALFSVLTRVVDEHLVADVPVAILLSGGLDSSIITALACQRGPIQTISMAFADSKVDERPFARRVSQFLGTSHTEVVFRPDEIAATLESAVWYVDDLFGDWGVISTMVLYRLCREAGAKVVLVGEGADELFGGYPDFAQAGGEDARGLGPNIRGLRLFRWFSGQRWGRELPWFIRLFRELDAESEEDPFSTVRLFETRHQLPSNYNMKVDKASMAAGVEARVPFLDQRVAEEAFRTPREALLREGTNKFLLRYMAERNGLLPRDVTRRPKFGGSIAASWIDDSESFRSFARDVILDPGGLTGALGMRKEMEDYFGRGRRGYPFPFAHSVLPILAWRLLMLNLWARRYGRGKNSVAV